MKFLLIIFASTTLGCFLGFLTERKLPKTLKEWTKAFVVAFSCAVLVIGYTHLVSYLFFGFDFLRFCISQDI